MSTVNPTMLLRDETVLPTNEVIKKVLGEELFGVYSELITSFTSELDLEPQWRYYNDGKAWLCKVVYRKKTILWLSLWQDCIKTSFYFTEKTLPGIMNLDIHPSIKEQTGNAAHIGKLIPLILDISRSEQLNNLKKIIQYKKESK